MGNNKLYKTLVVFYGATVGAIAANKNRIFYAPIYMYKHLFYSVVIWSIWRAKLITSA